MSDVQSLADLHADPVNARRHNPRNVGMIENALNEVGTGRSIVIDEDGRVLAGNATIEAAAQAGIEKVRVVDTDGETLVAVRRTGLTEAQKRRLALYDNRTAELADWDGEMLAALLSEDKDVVEGLFTDDELMAVVDDALDNAETSGGDTEAQVGKAEELQAKWQVEPGQVWRLGAHRVACGDCTDADVVARVMDGKKARMIFTDPPYGIGKDIVNDNLKREDWVQLYRDFTDTMLAHAIENAYVYVWGYFDTLSNYWHEVVKARGDCNFRNFIIWKKLNVQGRNTPEFRQFPEHYEAALLYIFGMPFQNGPWSVSPNAEHFPEIFEPLRAYLDGERQKMGWDIPTVKRMVGHSDLARDHWFSRSQWSMPTREVYETLRANARNAAFRREYDELRREYDELRREYDELRGHFDNTHGFTDLWEFDSLTLDDRHPTVKPVEVCERGIITTSKRGELVLDGFLGSGSTLLACENLGRQCRGIEIDPQYVAVTLERFFEHTGVKPELVQ